MPWGMIFITVISIGLGAAGSWWDYQKTSPGDPRNPIITGIIVGLLIETVLLLWKALHELSRHTTHLTRIHNETSGRLRDLATLRESLSHLKDTVMTTGVGVFDKYLASLSGVQRGIRLKLKDWAWDAHITFWRALADEQKTRGKNRPLHVQVTHKADIAKWKAQERVASLAAQNDFINAGGTITRVFIGRSDSPSAAYIAVMREMAARGIKDVYYLGGSDIPRNIPTFDFAWVKETNAVVKWVSHDVGQSVSEFQVHELNDSDVQDLQDLWDEIVGPSKSLVTFQSEVEPLAGKWFGYHYSTRANEEIMLSEWQVAALPSSEPDVTVIETLEEGAVLEYEGVKRQVGRLIYFELEGKHPERWHVVLGQPAIGSKEMTGVYCGSSRDWEPYAGLMLLSRTKIDAGTAKAKLGDTDRSIRWA